MSHVKSLLLGRCMKVQKTSAQACHDLDLEREEACPESRKAKAWLSQNVGRQAVSVRIYVLVAEITADA